MPRHMIIMMSFYNMMAFSKCTLNSSQMHEQPFKQTSNNIHMHVCNRYWLKSHSAGDSYQSNNL